jgi:hypothetical protein
MTGNYLREEAQSVQPLLALITKWLFTFTKKHLIFKRVLQGGIPTVTLVIRWGETEENNYSTYFEKKRIQ